MRRTLVIPILVLVLVVGLLLGLLPWAELREPLPAPQKLSQGPWLGVVGDSSVTGAAAHPEIQASWSALGGQAWDLLWRPSAQQELVLGFEPVTRVFYAQQEIPLRSLWLRNMEAKAALKLDSEELTFAYLVGRQMGIPPARITVAGQDGALLETLSLQLHRLLEVSPSLPPLLLISFVANDLCDPLVFQQSITSFRASYRATLREQLQTLATLPKPPEGTRVLFLPPLDLANLLTNPGLQAQKVRLDGEVTTCGELRDSRKASTRLSLWMQKVLIHECPSVLEPARDKARHLARVQELQAAQIQVLQEEIAELKAPGLRLLLASSVREIAFQEGDLANDCFHPSARGHARIADRLLEHELKLDP
ncbi:MAG: hypothetical protein KF799_05840 [Bdellovibrionales bacterium]|nr:hypothetical protein [Bdellovibrionales bacterium]